MTRKVAFIQPAEITRADRREMRRSVAQADRENRPKRARRRDVSLPPPAVGGPFGPGIYRGGYWNLARPNLLANQATSQHIAGIYPFVADGGLGHRGPIVGVDLNSDSLWHFSPWEAYIDASDRGALSTNILVTGAYRAGKSGTIKMLVTRSIAFGHKVVVPSDPKGEWVTVAEADPAGVVIRIGGGTSNRLNPLDRGPRRGDTSEEQDEQLVRQRRITTLISLMEMALGGTRLTAVEHAAVHEALARCIRDTGDRPTLRGVYEQLGGIVADRTDNERLSEGAVQPAFVLRRFVEGDLSGLFEDESTVTFDQDAPIVVVDTSELFARSDLVAQLTQVCTTAWIQAVISDRAANTTRYLVREEGWRDMTSLPALQMFQQWLKLSRHYGISNIIILHKIGDLDAVGAAGSQEHNLALSIIGDIENKFVFRVNHQEATHLRERLNIPEAHANDARQLRMGTFIAYVGQYSYLVDSFATSTPWEYQLFKTDDAVHAADETRALTLPDLNAIDGLWPDDRQDVAGWLAGASSEEMS